MEKRNKISYFASVRCSWVFPSGVQWRAPHVMLSDSLLRAYPIHLERLLMRMVYALSKWHCASNSSFEMVSGQNTLFILFKLFGLFVSQTDSWSGDLLPFSNILSFTKGWRRHSSGTALVLSCWAFWMHSWPCLDGYWCCLLLHNAWLCCLKR